MLLYGKIQDYIQKLNNKKCFKYLNNVLFVLETDSIKASAGNYYNVIKTYNITQPAKINATYYRKNSIADIAYESDLKDLLIDFKAETLFISNEGYKLIKSDKVLGKAFLETCGYIKKEINNETKTIKRKYNRKQKQDEIKSVIEPIAVNIEN